MRLQVASHDQVTILPSARWHPPHEGPARIDPDTPMPLPRALALQVQLAEAQASLHGARNTLQQAEQRVGGVIWGEVRLPGVTVYFPNAFVSSTLLGCCGHLCLDFPPSQPAASVV